MFSVTFMRSWPSAFEMGTIRLAEAAAAAGTSRGVLPFRKAFPARRLFGANAITVHVGSATGLRSPQVVGKRAHEAVGGRMRLRARRALQRPEGVAAALLGALLTVLHVALLHVVVAHPGRIVRDRALDALRLLGVEGAVPVEERHDHRRRAGSRLAEPSPSGDASTEVSELVHRIPPKILFHKRRIASAPALPTRPAVAPVEIPGEIVCGTGTTLTPSFEAQSTTRFAASTSSWETSTPSPAAAAFFRRASSLLVTTTSTFAFATHVSRDGSELRMGPVAWSSDFARSAASSAVSDVFFGISSPGGHAQISVSWTSLISG